MISINILKLIPSSLNGSNHRNDTAAFLFRFWPVAAAWVGGWVGPFHVTPPVFAAWIFDIFSLDLRTNVL
jgi:hypothetical protein